MTGAKHIWIIGLAIVVFTMAKLLFIEKGFSEDLGLPFNAYYVAEAYTHCLLALFIYLNFNKGWLIALLFILTLCNLADELIFNPLIVEIREIGLVVTFFIGWYAHYKVKEYETFCD